MKKRNNIPAKANVNRKREKLQINLHRKNLKSKRRVFKNRIQKNMNHKIMLVRAEKSMVRINLINLFCPELYENEVKAPELKMGKFSYDRNVANLAIYFYIQLHGKKLSKSHKCIKKCNFSWRILIDCVSLSL